MKGVRELEVAAALPFGCRVGVFFQAEDGIRDGHVTGVQTCALPILLSQLRRPRQSPRSAQKKIPGQSTGREIGRASCRERVEMSAVAVAVKKKKHKTSHASDAWPRAGKETDISRRETRGRETDGAET